MPRSMTPPIVHTVADVATLDAWGVQIARGSNHAVDLENSRLTALVRLHSPQNSSPIERPLSFRPEQLPRAVLLAIRNLHTALLEACEAHGTLPPGIDTPDF